MNLWEILKKVRNFNMCSLFGLIDYGNYFTAKQKEKIIRILSVECEVRGTDATGVAYVENEEVKVYKQPLPAHKIKMKFKSNHKIIMGHTRMTTKGDERFNQNNHPFYSKKLKFALAHNGVIYNDEVLRNSEKLSKTKIETDTYVVVQLLEKETALNFESLKNMTEKIKGSFCFTVLNNKNEMFFVKGSNPLAIYDFGKFYLYASTDEILKNALKKLRLKERYRKIEVNSGDMIKIDYKGDVEKSKFEIDDFELYGFEHFGMYDSYGFFDNEKCKCEDYWLDEYLESIIDYAKFVGIDESDVFRLMDMGFDVFDIEEMIYEKEMVKGYLGEGVRK